jgi:hypothetical protein
VDAWSNLHRDWASNAAGETGTDTTFLVFRRMELMNVPSVLSFFVKSRMRCNALSSECYSFVAFVLRNAFTLSGRYHASEI